MLADALAACRNDYPQNCTHFTVFTANANHMMMVVLGSVSHCVVRQASLVIGLVAMMCHFFGRFPYGRQYRMPLCVMALATVGLNRMPCRAPLRRSLWPPFRAPSSTLCPFLPRWQNARTAAAVHRPLMCAHQVLPAQTSIEWKSIQVTNGYRNYTLPSILT